MLKVSYSHYYYSQTNSSLLPFKEEIIDDVHDLKNHQANPRTVTLHQPSNFLFMCRSIDYSSKASSSGIGFLVPSCLDMLKAHVQHILQWDSALYDV